MTMGDDAAVTILVTGATGNVGSAVVAALVAAGRPVRAVVRNAESARRLPEGTFEGWVADNLAAFGG